MNNINILEEANDIVFRRGQEKDRQYGDFKDGMHTAAKIASKLCNKEITTQDMYNCMISLKLQRGSISYKKDTYLDGIAYLASLDDYYNCDKYIEPKINKNIKFKIYKDIWENGQELTIRGLKVKELTNYTFTISPYDRFFNFKGRKMNLDYIKQELKWYLRGDNKDLSILLHAKIWKDLTNEDKTINSNYGYLVFNGQFDNVIKTLIKDKYSRRAVIMFGNKENYMSDTNDYICTLSMTLQIRNNKLNAYTPMRSNDAIFGLTNDIPFFTILQEMIYIKLKDHYKDLSLGTYTHTAHSMHIYKRHYKMTKNILSNACEDKVICPKIKNSKEVDFLLSPKKIIPNDFDFCKWLFN